MGGRNVGKVDEQGDHNGTGVAPHSEQLEVEYRALAEGPALVDRSSRALLEITGTDRATWLHNLTTNEVKNLSPGEGNYAFALNNQGRILFDLNIIVREQAIWVDLDRRFLDFARAHFDKYVIMEDIGVTDRTPDFARMGLAGEGTKRMLDQLGAPTAAVLPWLATVEMAWGDVSITVLRHDFCGPYSVELFAPVGQKDPLRKALCNPSLSPHATPVGSEAVRVRRIEAGIPWPPDEINDEYLPAETGQFDRAVSFTKGCYLGQEVVERMRTREVVARRFIGLDITGDAIPPTDAVLTSEEGTPIGKLTSACRSLATGGVIGLGYVKTASAEPGTSLCVSLETGTVNAVVAVLPFVAGPTH